MKLADSSACDGHTAKKQSVPRWFKYPTCPARESEASTFRTLKGTGHWPALVPSIAFCLSAAGPACANSIWDFQEPVTSIAHESMAISVEFIRIVMAIYAAVFAIFIYSVFRHRKSAGSQPAAFTGPATKWQWALAASPFVLLIYIDYVLMGIPAFHAIAKMEDARTAAEMVVKVTASQWKWQYEYPEEGIKFVSNTATTQDQIHDKEEKGDHYLLEVDHPLVLPTNRKVRILLTSTDVIHAWWVPSFGVKRDAVPGYLREMWVNIDKPGTYRGQCAQLCGDGHSFMPIIVEAVAEPQFRDWVAKKKSEGLETIAVASKVWNMEELMAKGADIYNRICIACHQADGKGLPGVFPALAGSKIVNGQFLDEKGRLLKDGHLDRVMNGKPGTAMAAFKNTLSDAEIAAVVTYERNSFGNHMGDMVQPLQIKALR